MIPALLLSLVPSMHFHALVLSNRQQFACHYPSHHVVRLTAVHRNLIDMLTHIKEPAMPFVHRFVGLRGVPTRRLHVTALYMRVS